jgi:Ca2+-binding RTX toxin-like protein
VGTVDCGAGADTIHLNQYDRPGGVSNRRAVAEGRIAGCEQVLETPAEIDPREGLTLFAGPGGETLEGTALDDTLHGGHGADLLLGGDGDDVPWGNRLVTGPSRGTDRIDGGPGPDTVFGSRGRTAARACGAPEPQPPGSSTCSM